MKKVNFYIDGFNLYHSAFKYHKVVVDNQTITAGWPELRWQNLYSLMEQFVNPKTEEIGSVFYFTANPSWIKSKSEKHQNYISALLIAGVSVIQGKFKEKEKRCQAQCRQTYISHEEKESDVNIAINLLSDILLSKCDIAYLVSGDSDIVPAIKKAKQLVPSCRIGLIIPPYQKGLDLRNNVDFYKKITRKHLKKSLFPKEITIGTTKIIAPEGWIPKHKNQN